MWAFWGTDGPNHKAQYVEDLQGAEPEEQYWALGRSHTEDGQAKGRCLWFGAISPMIGLPLQ